MDATDFESRVYVGLWRDWSRGSVLGRILTLSRTDANLLITFTAFFISFVATRFWRILALLIHRHCSTAQPRHALHHQQQVILRNSSTPGLAFMSMFRLWWAWRKLGLRRRMRVISVSSIAALTLAAFTVAGGFSAEISSSVGDKVLIKSRDCGILAPTNNGNSSIAHERVVSGLFANAADYAQQCYSTSRSGLLNCNRFVKEILPSTVDYNAPCPFAESMCSSTSNIRLDSGHIKANDGLGLNTNEMREISYRYVTHCAPLVTKNYTSLVNTSKGDFVRYHYGQRVAGKPGNRFLQDFVFQAPTVESQYSRAPEQEGDRLDDARFKLLNTWTNVWDGKADPEYNAYTLLPELTRSDGDLALVFLQGNGVIFNQRTNDDWYRATVSGGPYSDYVRDGSSEFFIPEEAASPMGCVLQNQLCYAEQCGPLASWNDAIVGSASYFNSTPEETYLGQAPIGNRLATSLYWLINVLESGPVGLDSILVKLGPSSLASQSLFKGGVQFVSQPDQWKQDVQNWFNIILAELQSVFTSVVFHPADPELDEVRFPPTDEFQQTLCDSQAIRSTSHTSFSVFGLLFTYIVGGLIIIVSEAIEPLLRFVQRRYRFQTYEQLEWTTNEHLQLHRLAQEELGYGEWTECTDAIPITGANEVLGSIDITNLEHPVIIEHPREPEKGVPEDVPTLSITSITSEEIAPAEGSSASATATNDEEIGPFNRTDIISTCNGTTTTMLTDQNVGDLPPTAEQPNEAATHLTSKQNH
ncbi:hypothetical protein F4679DRAFT_544969 [Xylaria curta]|nr:hypothetical protein F4679DRAFT_544969 [Xylaria curta]